MPSGSLASRSRPSRLSDVVGQPAAVSALSSMLSSGDFPPQLLIAGPSGVGKTTLARVVSSSILCLAREGVEPCGSCLSCSLVEQVSHPDMVEVDAASYGGKDRILELAARARSLPVVASSRVFILDEAHGLTSAASHSFLKVLEEPPPGVHFFLCTTDPDRILSTVRSRCVELHLGAVHPSDVVACLMSAASREGWGLRADVAARIVELSDASLGVRGALNSLSKVAPPSGSSLPVSASDVELVLAGGSRDLSPLVAAVSSGSPASALDELDVAREHLPDERIVSHLVAWCRDRLVAEFESSRFGVWRSLLAELSDASGPSLDAWVVGAAHASTTRAGGSRGGGSAPPAASSPSEGHSSTGRARLLAAAAPSPTELPDLLGRCRVEVGDSAVEVVYPERLSAAVERMAPVLRTAAGRLGLPLLLSAGPEDV